MTVPPSASMAPFPSVSRRAFLSSGGAGEVFLDPRRPEWCIKRFHQPLKGEAANSLLRLCSLPNSLRPSAAKFLETRFSWPLEIFGDFNHVIGFAMPLAPPNAYFDLKVAGKQSRQLLQAKYLMDLYYWQSPAVQSVKPAVSPDDRLRISIDFSRAVSLLSSIGLSYGDVSGNNICIALGENPRVFFLDADSIEFSSNSPEQRLTTIDWISPIENDRVQRTRSLAALFVWRLLSEAQTTYPALATTSNGPLIDAPLVSQIFECYQSGSPESLDAMIEGLRRRVTTRGRRIAVEDALSTGFARNVVDLVGDASDPWESATLARAKTYLDFEGRLELCRPSRRRLYIHSYLSTPQEFQLDLPPATYKTNPPRSEQELFDLAVEARFAEIARFFAKGELESLSDSSVAIRSVGHALADASGSSLEASTAPGVATILWKWPESEFVNCAELSASTFNGKASTTRLARNMEVATIYSIALDQGGSLSTSIRFGCLSPSGTFVRSSIEAHLDVEIPPARRSRRAIVGLQGQSSQPMTPIFEIAVENQLADSEEAKRRQKRKRVRIALIAAVIPLIAGVPLTLRWFQNPPAIAPLEDCRILHPEGPSDQLLSC